MVKRMWRVAVMAVAVVVLCCESRAAERVKANNTNNLNVASSWTGSAVPGFADIARWNNTVTAENAVLLGGNLHIQGIVIANPGGTVAIGGSHTLTNSFVGINMGAATADLIITNQSVVFSDYASQLWTVPAGRTLTFSPVQVTRRPGTAVGVVGAGTVASAVFANDATGIIAPWAWVGVNANVRYATVSGGTVAGYTGGTPAATAAGVTDTTGTANYDVAAAGTVGAGASANTLRYTGGAGTIAGSLALNGAVNAGAGGLTFSGSVAAGSNRELVFASPDQTRQLSVSGTVTDGAGGASGVTVTGGGKVNLNGSNTYSGQTVVSAGTLYINNSNALGSAAGNTVIYVNGSSVTGGMLQVAGSLTLSEPLTFVGSGDGAPWASALAVASGAAGGTNTLAGPVTLATSYGVRITASGNGTALYINAPITRTGSGSTLILGAGGAGGEVIVNAPINNNGGSLTTHNGPGLVRINAAGCNVGTLNVQTGQRLQLGVNDAFISSMSLQIGSGASTAGDQARGIFDLNGYNQTVGNFNGDGAASEPVTLRVVTNSSASLSVLTIGGSGTFNGIIDGNIALVKSNGGVQTNRGPNRYTGGTTLNGGTLVVSNAVNHGSLAVNSGLFKFAPSLTVNGTLSGWGGTIDTGDAGWTLTVNQTGASSFSGALIGAGALVKNGPGALTLFGTNTYSGGTTVTTGTLCIGKSVSKPASGTITVAAGAGFGLGVGGGYTTADVDALWASGSMAGVSLDPASLVAIDTSAGDTTYATSQSTRGLVKAGTNILALTGANSYPGLTWVAGGVLAVPSTSVLPGWDTAGRFRVSRDAGLAVGNMISDAEFAAILATGNFEAGGCVGFDTGLGNRTYASVISNTANGALGVVKIGTNTLTLTGANTYDGNTYLNGGIVVVKDSSALGSTNGYTVVTRTGGSAPLFTDATGQLVLDGAGGPLVVGENLYISGDQQHGYRGALRSSAGTNTLNGWIMVTQSARIGVDNGVLILNGPVWRANSSLNPMLVMNPNGGYLIASNRIDMGSGGLLNFHSGGTTIICSTSNVWGSSQIQYGGIVRLGADEAMAVGKRVWIGNSEPGNGRLDLYGYNQTLGGLSEYGTAASKPNNIVTNSRPASSSTLTISQGAGAVDYFSGRIQGAISVVKAGAATSVQALAGANTYSGDTGIAGGVLVVSNELALMNSTLNYTNANGTLCFGAGMTAFTLGGLAGSVGIGLTNSVGAAITLAVGGNGASTLYSGNLTGAGGLTKAGNGTLTLSGTNSYSGDTTLSAGALALGSNGAASPNSKLVLAGGTLQAGGRTAAFGALQVTGNATLDLGDGSGTLTFANSAAQSWSGVLNVTGEWTATSLRVGTTSGGLSPTQVHRFSYNGERLWVQIDANGYLRKMSGSLMLVR